MSNALTLPPDLAAKVQAHIDSGAAADAVEVVRAGLEALEAAEAAKLEAVRAKVARALADPRPSIPADDVFARVSALIGAAPGGLVRKSPKDSVRSCKGLTFCSTA